MIQKIRNEPVLLVTLAIVVLTAAQDAMTSGADVSTIVVAAVQAALGFVARNFVTPVR